MRISVKLFLVLLLLIATVVLFFSLQLMMASVYLRPAESFLNNKNYDDRADQSEIEAVDMYLDKALSYYEYPAILETKGEVLLAKNHLEHFEIQQEDKQPETMQNSNDLKKALYYFDQALQKNPAMARTYVLYAATKAMLDEFDEKFYQSFSKAREYGDHSYEVQAGLAQLGLSFWEQLPLENKVQVKDSFIKAYRLAPGKTISYAKDNNKSYMACLWVFDEKVHSAECKKLLGLNKIFNAERQ